MEMDENHSLFALTVEGEYGGVNQVIAVEAEDEEHAREVFEEFDLYDVSVDTIYNGSTRETVFAPSLRVAEQLAPTQKGEYQDGFGDGSKVESINVEITNVKELTGDKDDWSLEEYHAEGEYRNRKRLPRENW